MATLSKHNRGVTTKITEARLKRLRLQNSKLMLELKRLKGEVVPAEDLKRKVLTANEIVKQRLLALPSKYALQIAGLTSPGEIEVLLRDGITEAINELAYEHGGIERP